MGRLEGEEVVGEEEEGTAQAEPAANERAGIDAPLKYSAKSLGSVINLLRNDSDGQAAQTLRRLARVKLRQAKAMEEYMKRTRESYRPRRTAFEESPATAFEAELALLRRQHREQGKQSEDNTPRERQLRWNPELQRFEQIPVLAGDEQPRTRVSIPRSRRAPRINSMQCDVAFALSTRVVDDVFATQYGSAWVERDNG